MLNLFFKRAVLFLYTDANGVSRRYSGVPSSRGPVPVPDWVKETMTYKANVAAGDVIDLTPPTAKAKKAAEKVLAEANPGKTEDEIAAAVKAEQPAIPLGIQPESAVETVGAVATRPAAAKKAGK